MTRFPEIGSEALEDCGIGITEKDMEVLTGEILVMIGSEDKAEVNSSFRNNLNKLEEIS